MVIIYNNANSYNSDNDDDVDDNDDTNNDKENNNTNNDILIIIKRILLMLTIEKIMINILTFDDKVDSQFIKKSSRIKQIFFTSMSLSYEVYIILSGFSFYLHVFMRTVTNVLNHPFSCFCRNVCATERT
jgi:hypothetical protein